MVHFISNDELKKIRRKQLIYFYLVLFVPCFSGWFYCAYSFETWPFTDERSLSEKEIRALFDGRWEENMVSNNGAVRSTRWDINLSEKLILSSTRHEEPGKAKVYDKDEKAVTYEIDSFRISSNQKDFPGGGELKSFHHIIRIKTDRGSLNFFLVFDDATSSYYLTEAYSSSGGYSFGGAYRKPAQ